MFEWKAEALNRGTDEGEERTTCAATAMDSRGGFLLSDVGTSERLLYFYSNTWPPFPVAIEKTKHLKMKLQYLKIRLYNF